MVFGAALASFGLITLALLISVLDRRRARDQGCSHRANRIAPWLTALTTIGLAMPGFYVGSLLIMAVLLFLIYGPFSIALPVQGFGWDLHLLLPDSSCSRPGPPRNWRR